MTISFVLDVIDFGLKDPRLLSIGGNTGKVNTFTGVDPSALTKGIFNGATLTQGNNLECFIFQLIVRLFSPFRTIDITERFGSQRSIETKGSTGTS